MGLTYHFTITAPATATPEDLMTFLKGVELEAKAMRFEPTLVLNAVFDTTEQKQFARRLTTGLPVEDARLKGADIPDDSRVWCHDSASGMCRVPPMRGVVLVVTNEQGSETIFGFFQYAHVIKDTKGRVVAETGLHGAWSFRDFVKSPDPRFRQLIKRFAEAGYVGAEDDEFAPE
jgi:hypothetical protein